MNATEARALTANTKRPIDEEKLKDIYSMIIKAATNPNASINDSYKIVIPESKITGAIIDKLRIDGYFVKVGFPDPRKQCTYDISWKFLQ